VRFIRRCESDYPFYNVSVLASGVSLPNEPGNVMSEDPPADGKGYESRLELVWEGERKLRVARNPEMKLKSSSMEVGGVVVEQATTFLVGT
jgi:hypothetical protein